MLPYKKYKGKEALKRLRVFINTPEELKNKEKITFSEIDSSKLRCSFIKVSDLSYKIGWKK
jgi:large subunit ribosomal protein L13